MIEYFFNLITLGIGLFMTDFKKRKQRVNDKFEK